jgi:muramoyltetrapeptide carboxypeptidase
MSEKVIPNRRPPVLSAGDKIGIVAPARKVSPEEMAPALTMLRTWGYVPLEAQHLYHADQQFSGSDHERYSDFQMMLDDPSVKAILCARGGYGSVRIIDRLDFTAFAKNPKWIIGFSDITVFHSHINSHHGIQTLHAPMAINFPPDGSINDSLKSLKLVLSGGYPEYHFGAHPFNKPGTASGILCGGNLSMLYSLIGSPSDIDTNGKILFLEDLDEYLYHIDRMMMNLMRSGKLSKLAGLLVGGMNDMNDNPRPFGKTAYEIIAGLVEKYHFPVIFDFKSGHISQNLALIMGGHAEMICGSESSLTFNQ